MSSVFCKMPLNVNLPPIIVTDEPPIQLQPSSSRVDLAAVTQPSTSVDENDEPNWLLLRCFCGDQTSGRTCYLVKKECGSWFHIISHPNNTSLLPSGEADSKKLVDGRVVEICERLAGPVVGRVTSVSQRTSMLHVAILVTNIVELAIMLLDKGRCKHSALRQKNSVKKFLNEHFALLADGRVQFMNVHQFKKGPNARAFFQFIVKKVLPTVCGVSSTKTAYPMTGCANVGCVFRKRFAPKHGVRNLADMVCAHTCPVTRRSAVTAQAYSSKLQELHSELTRLQSTR